MESIDNTIEIIEAQRTEKPRQNSIKSILNPKALLFGAGLLAYSLISWMLPSAVEADDFFISIGRGSNVRPGFSGTPRQLQMLVNRTSGFVEYPAVDTFTRPIQRYPFGYGNSGFNTTIDTFTRRNGRYVQLSSSEQEQKYATKQDNLEYIKERLDDIAVYEYSIKGEDGKWSNDKVLNASGLPTKEQVEIVNGKTMYKGKVVNVTLDDMKRVSDVAIRISEFIDGEKYNTTCFMQLCETRNADALAVAGNYLKSTIENFGYVTYTGSEGHIVGDKGRQGELNIAIAQFRKALVDYVTISNQRK